MNIESFREYCIKKPGVTEEFPFDEVTLVFKVGGKIFALTDLLEFDSINLKAAPDRSIELREHYDEIQPGFHMNKKHWNTVKTRGKLPVALLKELIDHSYELVYNSLTHREKVLIPKS
ncbi:MAG: MmcQ/YjbR family DNA-binding protein [Cyclobacteriaceae bacterium]|nr:MmcQ/YjbR family DNA-binding protein [Cyclobacteriaceae bacterium]